MPSLLNRPLESVFGEGFRIEQHIEKVVIIVVVLSISPMIYAWLKSKLGCRNGKSAPEQAACV